MDYEIVSFTARNKYTMFDIMVGERWRGQITMTMIPGMAYPYEELKEMTRKERPSLSCMDFDLVPTEQKVLR